MLLVQVKATKTLTPPKPSSTYAGANCASNKVRQLNLTLPAGEIPAYPPLEYLRIGFVMVERE
jgi:hypothetical protein